MPRHRSTNDAQKGTVKIAFFMKKTKPKKKKDGDLDEESLDAVMLQVCNDVFFPEKKKKKKRKIEEKEEMMKTYERMLRKKSEEGNLRGKELEEALAQAPP